MWDRQSIKEQGKANMRKNYWRCVLASLLFVLFCGGGASYSYRINRTSFNAEDYNSLSEAFSDPAFIEAFSAIMFLAGIVLIVLYLLTTFVFNPLLVGIQRFFVANQYVQADENELGYGFKNRYGNIVLTLFLRNLLISLAALLFLIPGIILSYSYRLVPYILADDPNVSATDALKISRDMMNGIKWEVFVYDLSYIGWFILNAFTFNLLAILYLRPYKLNADAALYLSIRGNGPAQQQPQQPQQFSNNF